MNFELTNTERVILLKMVNKAEKYNTSYGARYASLLDLQKKLTKPKN